LQSLEGGGIGRLISTTNFKIILNFNINSLNQEGELKMRKLFVVLTAVVALTAASKAMLVWAADEAAPEAAMTDTMMANNEVMNDATTANEAAAEPESNSTGTGNTY
jgi:hypothetical protein